MPELKVDAVVNLAGTGKPNFPVSPTHSGGSALSTMNTYSYTSSGTEPSSPKNGAIWWDSSNNKVMVYIDNKFKEIELNTDYPTGAPAYLGPRGFSIGGSSATNTIQYFDISAGSGNASDFGDLLLNYYDAAAVSNGSRIVLGGGYSNNSPAEAKNVLQYWASATTGNSTDFGDLTSARYHLSAAGDATRGIWAAGRNSSNLKTNTMDYITIASAGNATDFGDRTINGADYISSTNDATYSVFGSGEQKVPPSSGTFTGYTNTLDYVTTQTTANATDFGDRTVSTYDAHQGVVADATRGLFAGGYISSSPYATNVIDYITIASPGNATDFGDLDTGRYGPQGTSDGTTGVFMGGGDLPGSSGDHDKIQKVSIQTAANATDFGNLVSTSLGYSSGAGASGAAS
tara:strand:- start:1375 stop:2580 length:1206 start_codon:yes stop_codon:yes gene_type:complete